MTAVKTEPAHVFFFLICLLIITLNNYIYNTTKTNKKNTLTRDINRVQQNYKLSNYYRAKRNYKNYNRAMK